MVYRLPAVLSATVECDASDAYKQAYINADEQDIQIIKSPVGMPGRALRNKFIQKLDNARVLFQNVITASKSVIRQRSLIA